MAKEIAIFEVQVRKSQFDHSLVWREWSRIELPEGATWNGDRMAQRPQTRIRFVKPKKNKYGLRKEKAAKSSAAKKRHAT